MRRAGPLYSRARAAEQVLYLRRTDLALELLGSVPAAAIVWRRLRVIDPNAKRLCLLRRRRRARIPNLDRLLGSFGLESREHGEQREHVRNADGKTGTSEGLMAPLRSELFNGRESVGSVHPLGSVKRNRHFPRDQPPRIPP
jgi:hypothetical protein